MESKKSIFQKMFNCFTPTNSYPDDVKDFILKYSKNFVRNIVIVKTPLENLLQSTIYLLAPEAKVDGTLYHLQLILTLDNDKKFILEKCATINIQSTYSVSDKSKQLVVDMNKPILFDTLLTNTKNFMGTKRYFWYSAKDSNCQDFALSVLKSNNLSNEQYETFIKQNTSNIFDGKIGNKISIIFNGVTDIDADFVIEEEKIFKNN